MTAEILWNPAIPPLLIGAMAVIGMIMLLAQVFRAGMRGVIARSALLAALVLVLLNPRISVEERTSESDIALIVVDDTSSQRVGERRERTTAAVADLTARMEALGNMEVRTVTVTDGKADRDREGTRLAAAVTEALGDLPGSRFAGAVIVTDGQIHDADTVADGGLPGPLHVLVTGDKDEIDRRLVVTDAPGYGIVGHDITVSYQVEEQTAGSSATGEPVSVSIRVDGEERDNVTVLAGEEVSYDLTLEHEGATFIEIEAEARDGELSTVNNRAVVSVNGVRDRLRVLLVSGQPHAGERTWRNLLKSDPSVDLVHFTILRPPEKNDFTPLNEISLIAFPVRELFEEKIDEFDLIVFDRYMVRDVLPPSYFRNIADYVRGGGAVMLSVGPEYAGLRSLARTPLSDILPAEPTGRIMQDRFKPRISDLGHRHPVTSGLPGAVVPGRDDLDPTWGAWYRHIAVTASTAPTLMNGAEGNPLLLMQRIDEGRVALFASDHLWLWARGYDGGGPQAELMRRVAHWLMKEPELDEQGLFAEVRDGELRIESRSLSPGETEIVLESPSGERQTLTLTPESAGISVGRVPVDEIGLYRIESGDRIALAPAGSLNPLELADLRATDVPGLQLAAAAGGSARWLVDGMPDVRGVQTGRQSHGNGWIGLTRNEAFAVTGVTSVPLAPWWLVVVLGIGLAGLAWWREGR